MYPSRLFIAVSQYSATFYRIGEIISDFIGASGITNQYFVLVRSDFRYSGFLFLARYEGKCRNGENDQVLFSCFHCLLKLMYK